MKTQWKNLAVSKLRSTAAARRALPERIARALHEKTLCLSIQAAPLPHLYIVEGGATFVLCLSDTGLVWPEIRQFHLRLRDAGARVEVVKNLPEALERLRDWNIRLKPYSERRQ